MKKFLSSVLLCAMIVLNIYTISYGENTENSSAKQETQQIEEKSNRVKTAENAKVKTKEEKKEPEKEKNTATEEKNEKSEKTEIVTKESSDPEVLSDAAFLINSNTGKILFEKNAHKRMFPASTTKILTAYLALNNLDLNSNLTASKEAIDIPSDSSKLGILEGEILTVEQLLYALMIQSSNDAANVLAEAVSGSVTEFVVLMNQTAQNLGMNNSNFVNAHGYHDDNHYTTAFDMAIIAQKAMENPVFAKIVSTKSYEIPPTNKHPEPRKFYTRNVLMSVRSNLELQYLYTNGIKTGNTEKAGQCFVGSARRSGMDLISVVFHAPKNMPNRSFIDTKNMYVYAYTKYRTKTVLKADELASTCNVKWAFGKSHLVLKSNRDIQALLPKEDYHEEWLTNEIHINEKIVAPIKKGTELGEIHYFYNNEEVAVAKLYADRDVSRSYIKQIFSYLLSFWFLAILGLIVIIILLRKRKEYRRLARIREIKNKQNRGDYS